MDFLVFIALVWILASMSNRVDAVTPIHSVEDAKLGMQNDKINDKEYIYGYSSNTVLFGPLQIQLEPTSLPPCEAIQVILAFVDAILWRVDKEAEDLENGIAAGFDPVGDMLSRIFQQPDVHPFLFYNLLQLSTLNMLSKLPFELLNVYDDFKNDIPNYTKAQSCTCEGILCRFSGFREELNNLNKDELLINQIQETMQHPPPIWPADLNLCADALCKVRNIVTATKKLPVFEVPTAPVGPVVHVLPVKPTAPAVPAAPVVQVVPVVPVVPVVQVVPAAPAVPVVPVGSGEPEVAGNPNVLVESAAPFNPVVTGVPVEPRPRDVSSGTNDVNGCVLSDGQPCGPVAGGGPPPEKEGGGDWKITSLEENAGFISKLSSFCFFLLNGLVALSLVF
ncbi:hypothetical protein HMI54_014056 [Coelomomyces lativittatus]|nr:hypothetical protein HMI55_007249 [Coelomomyces lativittatus]KAJ1514513.1 hypothetical protein HMI54_014056 [Coelomomyces lativittatus]KAJ1515537.1 hypothetical protein HMI56_003931 [Coelomomyces lativittatus]